jgi:predicted kinase
LQSQPSLLIVLCGIPGAGKSTLAHHLVERWNATSFASESFAAELGGAARDASGDLTAEAIQHAYKAMANAAQTALHINRFVVAVGSFRSECQRRRFREIGAEAKAKVVLLRVVCPVDSAASRIRARAAKGEHGPTEGALQKIEADLSRATDIDIILVNQGTVQEFYRSVDALIKN